MRSEVYFLPPRTSVTDSVGISTLPILSCSPNAATRDSRDSFTLRSNPEYEWMMYHFMFGLRGVSVVVAAPSAAAVCDSPAVLVAASFFSSSCIMDVFPASRWFTYRSRAISSAALEKIKQSRHAVLNDEVDHEKVERENGNRDHHHRGRGPNFLPRGGSHFAHFGAHVVIESPDTLRPGFHPVTKAATGCCN